MNTTPYITLVSWETRNWRHRERAMLWCRDYGLKPVTKHAFVGELYSKERGELRAKFQGLFTSKTEKFFFAAMCKSCFNESMIGIQKKGIVGRTNNFELVQILPNTQ